MVLDEILVLQTGNGKFKVNHTTQSISGEPKLIDSIGGLAAYINHHAVDYALLVDYDTLVEFMEYNDKYYGD